MYYSIAYNINHFEGEYENNIIQMLYEFIYQTKSFIQHSDSLYIQIIQNFDDLELIIQILQMTPWSDFLTNLLIALGN